MRPGRGLVPLVVVALVAGWSDANAIPSFARRYKVSCSLCHNPIPKLTAFGEAFAGNGFRFASGEAPRDTIDTGDPLLSLIKDFPLAMRFDAYAQAYSKGRAATDFQTPFSLKILSGGPISKKLSYYFYTYLAERGEIAGVEDALIQLNDIGGKPLDLVIGQFQASDPMFKRETRLTFEDYVIYRARLGEVPVDLTYERGIAASADVLGFTVTGQVLNGNGIGEAESNRRFDNNAAKNFVIHFSRDLTSQIRIGAFGYTGRSESDGVKNRTQMFGVDWTVGGGTFEFNGQYLHRSDSRPFYALGEPRGSLDGGFGELIVRPKNSRWFGFGLYNLVTSDRAILDVRLGGAGNLRRYESISAGVGWLERRNFKWSAEVNYDPVQESLRWTLGLVTAF